VLLDVDGERRAGGAAVVLDQRAAQRTANDQGRVTFRSLPAGSHTWDISWDTNNDGIADRVGPCGL
jgi:hypothetical protein